MNKRSKKEKQTHSKTGNSSQTVDLLNKIENRMMNKSDRRRTAAICAPKQQKKCATNQTGLCRKRIVTQTENPIVTQNRTGLRQHRMLDKNAELLLNKSDQTVKS